MVRKYSKEEHYIQQAIVHYLNLNRIYCFAVPNGIFFNAKNKIAESKYIKYLKAEGFRSGVSDLVVLLPNRIIFIEVKSEKGKLNQNQKIFKKIVEELCYEYYICRCLDDVIKIL